MKSPPFNRFFFLFQTIMEQFNPCLRNFVAMGKNYEKALASKSFFFSLSSQIYFPCAFLCRFRHSAKDSISLSLCRSNYLWAILFCRRKDIYLFFTEGLGSYHAVRSLRRAPSPLGGVYSKADLM